jgi:hypothetical protein
VSDHTVEEHSREQGHIIEIPLRYDKSNSDIDTSFNLKDSKLPMTTNMELVSAFQYIE